MKRFFVGVMVGFLLATSITVFAAVPIKLIVNGQEITCDIPPQIIGGRTLVPARYVAEPLGATVEWDGTRNAVVITSSGSSNNSLSSDIIEKNLTEEMGDSKLDYVRVKVNDVLASDTRPFVILLNNELYCSARTAYDFIKAQNGPVAVILNEKTRDYTFGNSIFHTMTILQYDMIKLKELKDSGLLDYTWDEANVNLIVPNY